tara:strand:+ start:449 stop:871 length:423 start_codon:yes stop_codon:yes gene_type:complete
MKNKQNIILVSAGIAAISVFFPWIEVSASASIAGYGSSSFSTGGISGISLGGGIFGLILALAGGYMSFKKIKWAFLAGALNFIDGLSYMLGWAGSGGGASGSGFSSKSSVDPQFGLYLFVAASLVFSVFAFMEFRSSRTD